MVRGTIQSPCIFNALIQLYLHTEVTLVPLGFVVAFCSVAATNVKLQSKLFRAHSTLTCVFLPFICTEYS